MKTTLALLCVLLAQACFAAAPLSFPSLTTTHGVTYQDVKVTKLDALQVKFIHRDGVATVSLAELPEDLQKAFGYDPRKAEAEMLVKQEERRKNIIVEADKKAKLAAVVDQEELDEKELAAIRKESLRCYVDEVMRPNGALVVRVSPVAKQPVMLKSRKGKYERVELNGQGKPEMTEQPVADQEFSLGRTLQILPSTAGGLEGVITVYLVQAASAGEPAVCTLTPEDTLKCRRKVVAEKEEAERAARKKRP